MHIMHMTHKKTATHSQKHTGTASPAASKHSAIRNKKEPSTGQDVKIFFRQNLKVTDRT